MKLYTATVQINAEPDNQVVKHKLTAAEMKLLEVIHAGKKPVLIDIVHTGKVNRKDRAERARLDQIYCQDALAGTKWHGLIQKLFGVDGVPLPQAYEAPIIQAVEVFDLDDEEAEVEDMLDNSVRAVPITAEQLVG